MVSNKKLKHLFSTKDYNYIYSRVPRLCVDIVIRNEDGVLLSHRTIPPWKQYWHLPGGKVHYGEAIEQAVRRIAKSEIGLSVKVLSILGVITYKNKEVPAGHSVSIVYEVRPLRGSPKGYWQASDLRFFKEIPKKTIPVVVRFLKQIK